MATSTNKRRLTHSSISSDSSIRISSASSNWEAGSSSDIMDITPKLIIPHPGYVSKPIRDRELAKLKKGPVINVFTGKRPNTTLSVPNFPCQVLASFAPALAEELGKVTEKSRCVVVLDLDAHSVAWCLRLAHSGFSLAEAKNTSLLQKFPVDLNLSRLQVLLTLGQRSFVTYALLRITADAIMSNKFSMEKILWIFADPAPKLVRNFADHLIEKICNNVLNGTMVKPLIGARCVPYFRRCMRYAIITKRPEIEKMFFEDHMPLTRLQIAFIFEFTDDRDIAVRKAVARGLLWIIRQGYSLNGLDHVCIRVEYPALDNLMKEVDKTWQWYKCTTAVAPKEDIQLHLYHHQIKKFLAHHLRATSTERPKNIVSSVETAAAMDKSADTKPIGHIVDKTPTKMVIEPFKIKVPAPSAEKAKEKEMVLAEKTTKREDADQSTSLVSTSVAECENPKTPPRGTKHQGQQDKEGTGASDQQSDPPSILKSAKLASSERKARSVAFNLPEWTPEEEEEILQKHRQRKIERTEAMERTKSKVEMWVAEDFHIDVEHARRLIEGEKAIIRAKRAATLEKYLKGVGETEEVTSIGPFHLEDVDPEKYAPVVVHLPIATPLITVEEFAKKSQQKQGIVESNAKDVQEATTQNRTCPNGPLHQVSGAEAVEDEWSSGGIENRTKQVEPKEIGAKPTEVDQNKVKPAAREKKSKASRKAKQGAFQPVEVQPVETEKPSEGQVNESKPAEATHLDIKDVQVQQLDGQSDTKDLGSSPEKSKRASSFSLIESEPADLEHSPESRKAKRKAKKDKGKKAGSETATI